MSDELVPLSGRGGAMGPPGPGNTDEAVIAAFIRAKRSPHTRRAYEKDIQTFRAHTRAKALRQVTLPDLQDFVESLSGETSSRARRISAVKSLFRFAHRIGYLQFDPAAVVQLPKLKDTLAQRILTREEVERMLDGDGAETIFVRFLYVTGARIDEACRLRWADCMEREDGGQVTLFGKGDKTRAVYMSRKSWKALMELRRPTSKPEDHVFGVQPRRGQRIVKRIARRVGLSSRVSPHWLRHAHASHALEGGAPLPLVQATLGHTSLATTGRYTHVRPTDSSARYLGL